MTPRNIDDPKLREAYRSWEHLVLETAEDLKTETEFARMAEGLGKLLRFLTEFKVGKRNSSTRNMVQCIGRRTIILAWVVDPSIFEDSPSLRTLTKQLKIPYISGKRISGEVAKTFGITNRSQVHAWNRKKMEEL